jgi:hypothetical protein
MITVIATVHTQTTQLRIEVTEPIEYEVTCAWLEDHTFVTTNPARLFCRSSHRSLYCQNRVSELLPSERHR